MKTLIANMLAASTIFAATTANAAVVSITSVSATWLDAENALSTDTLAADMTNIVTTSSQTAVSWGEPVITDGPQSDYTFDQYASGIQTGPFIVGRFTHNNWPVYDYVIDAVDLALTVQGTVNDEVFSFSKIIAFQHDETPNDLQVCPYGTDANGCFDRVTISNLPLADSVELDGGVLNFTLLGFAPSLGDEPLFFFNTAEQSANRSFFVAEFDFDPVNLAPVPLPAAGWMLIAGIGGLVALRRRRKD